MMGPKEAEFQKLKSTLLGHTFLKNEVTDLLPRTSQLDLKRETERETEKGNRKSWIWMDLQKTIQQHCITENLSILLYLKSIC